MTVPFESEGGRGSRRRRHISIRGAMFWFLGKGPGIGQEAGASRVLGAKGVSQRRKGRSSYSSSRIAEGAPTYIDPPGRLSHRGTNRRFRALEPRRGSGVTRELHVYDHASGMIALLFVSPNGTVEAFDVEGFNRIGEFSSVAQAAAFACADVEMPRLDS